MRVAIKLMLVVFALALLLPGCEKNPGAPDYQKEITVFGYLWGNDTLNAERAIMIAYTQPVLARYTLENAAIRGASVTLTETSTGRVYTLNESPQRPGFYFNDSLVVQPKTTYNLEVKADGKVVRASTTVPPVLKLTTVLNPDSVNSVYQKNLSREKPILLEGESPDQIVLVDMYCNESYRDAEYTESFGGSRHPRNEEEYDGGVNGEPRHIRAMAKLGEFVSDEYPGQYVVNWYSSMIVFYGSNTMQVLAIDDNYHKFLYTEHPVYSGGVKGGLGVFGSVCGKTYQLMVLKP
ncbi:MAG: DUF4249 family protein [Candidatus Eisenbacteria bacterium]|nr:DUF4249 family protein [Candidatus Eisenbacteria bacterium]